MESADSRDVTAQDLDAIGLVPRRRGVWVRVVAPVGAAAVLVGGLGILVVDRTSSDDGAGAVIETGSTAAAPPSTTTTSTAPAAAAATTLVEEEPVATTVAPRATVPTAPREAPVVVEEEVVVEEPPAPEPEPAPAGVPAPGIVPPIGTPLGELPSGMRVLGPNGLTFGTLTLGGPLSGPDVPDYVPVVDATGSSLAGWQRMSEVYPAEGLGPTTWAVYDSDGVTVVGHMGFGTGFTPAAA